MAYDTKPNSRGPVVCPIYQRFPPKALAHVYFPKNNATPGLDATANPNDKDLVIGVDKGLSVGTGNFTRAQIAAAKRAAQTAIEVAKVN